MPRLQDVYLCVVRAVRPLEAFTKSVSVELTLSDDLELGIRADCVPAPDQP